MGPSSLPEARSNIITYMKHDKNIECLTDLSEKSQFHLSDNV